MTQPPRPSGPSKENPIEQVPDEVRMAARRAFADRDERVEVLDLQYDSLLDETTPDGPRRLSFNRAGPDAGVEVTVLVLEEGDFIRLHITSRGCRLESVHCDGNKLTVDASDHGVTEVTRHGLLSAVLSLDDQRLRTAWLRV